MAKTLNLKELQSKRSKLEKKVTEVSEDHAKRLRPVNFESMSNLNATIKHIENYEWTVKNAALVVNLYDNLKTQKTVLRKLESKETIVELGALDLNTLYTVLTTVTSTGISSARTFISLLTNIGKQISDAMKDVASGNEDIKALHIELSELDKEIEKQSAETVTADEISE
jgi:hypothetical protein